MLAAGVFAMGVEFRQYLRRERPRGRAALDLRRLSFSVILLWAIELFGVTGKQFVYFLF